MDSAYLSALQETLQQTFAPATVKQATARLSKEFYTNALALPSLLHLLQNAEQDQLKQLAAVEARKLVPTKWENVDPALQAQIRSALLQSTFAQPLKLVRHSSARVVAAIGDVDFSSGPEGTDNAWPELMPALVASVQDARDETAVYTLYCLLETQNPAVGAHCADFVALFSGLLADSAASVEIRVNAVLCLDCLAQVLEDDDLAGSAAAGQFKAAIPGMLDVLAGVIAANDADSVRAVFDVMNSLLYLDNKLVGDQIVAVIQRVAEVAAATGVDEEFRCMGLQFLISAASLRKTKISAANLGPQLAALATRIAGEEIDVEDELDNEDEENENEENEPASLALRLVGVLSGELPPLQVLAPFFESLPTLIASPDTFVRRAALLIVGVASSGAPDYIATQAAKIVPVLLRGLQDPEPVVQVAAVRAVAQLAAELQDAIADHHAQLLPLIMAIIDLALHVMSYKYACYALDGIIEFMGHDAIAQYMQPLMQKLFAMLQAASSSSLKTAIVSAIGSTAFAGGKGFTPYFNESVHTLEPFIANAANTAGMSEEDIELRAITFENISTMARAVGSESFSAYAKPLVEAAYSSIGAEHPRIRESGFAFISNMAKVYGAEFAGFLDEIVPQILKCLEQEEFSIEGGFDEDEDEDDEEDLDNKFKFNSGITIEKEIASVALAELAAGTGAAFAKFVEPSIKTLAEQIEVSYGMREAAMNSLWKIVRAMFTATYGKDFKAPKGVPQQSYVDASLLQLLEQARAITVSNLDEEFEFNLVACDLDNLTEALNVCGIAALVSSAADTSALEKTCVQLMNILKKEHACQIDDEEPLDEAEDTSESEAMLYESALEVLIVLSAQLGPDFVKIFGSFKDVILANVTSKSRSKRVASTGGLAEIAAGLGAENPYTQEFLLVFSDRLANDKSLEVQGNAAYGVGIIIEGSTADFSDSYQQILQMMFHLLSKSDEQASLDDGESKDVVNRCVANACGCVARMALKNSAAVPVEHVMPALLGHLPLDAGHEENVPILTWIIQLYESGNAAIEAQSERVIQVLAQIFQKEADRLKLVEESTLGREENIDKSKQFATKEVEEKVVNLVKFLNQKHAAAVASHAILKSVIA